MASSATNLDQNSSFEEKIAHLRQNGVSDSQISQHLSDVDDPSAKAWVNQYRLDQVEKSAKEKLGDNSNVSANTTTPNSSSIGGVNTSGFKGIANAVNDAANWYSGLTTPEKLGYPAATYLGVKAVNLGFRTLEDKVKAQTEVNKQKQIFALKNTTAAPTTEAPVAAPTATPNVPEPIVERPNPFAGTEGPPPPNELNDILQRMGKPVDNPGAMPETAPVETTESPKLSEWAAGAQPNAETGTPTGMTAEPTVVSTPEQTAIDALNGTTTPAATETPAATNEAAPAPKEANAAVKPKKSAVTVTLQPTGELPPQLTEIKGSIPPRVQKAAAAVPPEIQAKLAAEGKVGLKGYGSGDVSITNTYGKNAYAAIVDYFNNGQPIGTDENYKKVQGKINKGVPSELAPFFASKLPASEAEAGTFGSKELGERMAYTSEGKIVTSPTAIKNAVAKGGGLLMALSIADAVHAAGEGDYSKANALPLAAVPGVGAGFGLYHGEAGAPTITQRDDALKRPEVRKTLETLKQTLSPAEYEKASRQYLNKVGSFSGMTDRERLMADIQSSYRQLPSRNTLLPVAPPSR